MIAFHRLNGRRAIWTAAGLFAVAIFGLHFTGHGRGNGASRSGQSRCRRSRSMHRLMVFAVSGATLVIMLSGIASTAIMENQMRRQREGGASRSEPAVRHGARPYARGRFACSTREKRLVVCNGRYAETVPAAARAGETRHAASATSSGTVSSTASSRARPTTAPPSGSLSR